MNKLHGEVRSDDDSVSVEDMANVLYESDVLTKRLEEQIGFYQVMVIYLTHIVLISAPFLLN